MQIIQRPSTQYSLRLFWEKCTAWVFQKHFYCGSIIIWRQFVQIDDRSSEMAPVHFGVPQGSILGPVLFNLYVADLQGMLDYPCYQYADDTTFYLHSKVPALAQCSVELNGVLSRLGDYSESSNLPSTVQRLNGCSFLHLKWHASTI